MADETKVKITDAHWDAVWQMRAEGYAIVVFTPNDLKGAPQDELEERLFEVGWKVIEREKDPYWHDPEPTPMQVMAEELAR